MIIFLFPYEEILPRAWSEMEVAYEIPVGFPLSKTQPKLPPFDSRI